MLLFAVVAAMLVLIHLGYGRVLVAAVVYDGVQYDDAGMLTALRSRKARRRRMARLPSTYG